MVHRLPVDDDMVIAKLAERPFGKQGIGDLCFLQAQYVGGFLTKEALDNVDAGTDRIDIPRSDTKGGCHGGCLGAGPALGKGGLRKSKTPIPGAFGMGVELAFVTLKPKGDFGATGNRGKTAQPSILRCIQSRAIFLSAT